MYESHFGLSGPPFQLVPDPGFYFGSRGHSNALAFLQSAAHQGDGFLVVTGEIGAGKTTLVRTLLEGLDAKQVLAATMVSTQLEFGDLPLAILLAFGAPQAGETKAQLNAALEAFLIDLAGKGRRALLIVDEAQNLNRTLVEDLRMLSNLQLGSSALLQVFLVGQPELRTQMQGKAMEQLRQRVTASCHLGPMDGKETRAYVEHRLRRVGWVDRPPIETYAFDQIHQWTAGIPRRINRLCNRLLLATFLERKDSITAEAVDQIARDLRAEIGESDDQPKMEESYVSRGEPQAPPLAVSAASRIDADPPVAAAVPIPPRAEPDPESTPRELPAGPPGLTALMAIEPSAEPLIELPAPLSEPVAAAATTSAPIESPETAIPDALTALEAMPAFSLARQARAANGGREPRMVRGQEVPSQAQVESVSTRADESSLPPRATISADDSVIEEDDELENDRPPPVLSGPTAKPHGVVAAHETALPSLKTILGEGRAAPGRPSMQPAFHVDSAASTSAAAGSTATAVDVPLDFFELPLAPSSKAEQAQTGLVGTPAVRPPMAAHGLTGSMSAGLRPAGAIPAAAKGILEPLVCLVDSPTDYIKARALGRVLSDHRDLPSVLIVHTASVASLDLGEEISGVMPQKMSDVHLDINEHGGAASAALAITRFDAVLRVYRPKAILAMGASDTLLTCALFAHKSGIPILRNDAGRRRAWSRAGEEMNALLLERLADTSYISDLATYYTLYRSGIPTDRVLLVGNLADNVVHFAAQHTLHPAEILRRVGTPVEILANSKGYALCTAQFDLPRSAHDDVTGLISMLTLVGRELPVLWAANEGTLQELKSLGKQAGLKAARVEVAPSLRYLDGIDLLRGARCLLSGSAGHYLDEAVTLGVQSIVLGHGIVVPVKTTEALQLGTPLGADQLTSVLAELLASPVEPRDKAPFWDGATATRIAAHLGEWLPLRGANRKRSTAASATSAAGAQRPKHPDAAIELLGAATN